MGFEGVGYVTAEGLRVCGFGGRMRVGLGQCCVMKHVILSNGLALRCSDFEIRQRNVRII